MWYFGKKNIVNANQTFKRNVFWQASTGRDIRECVK